MDTPSIGIKLIDDHIAQVTAELNTAQLKLTSLTTQTDQVNEQIVNLQGLLFELNTDRSDLLNRGANVGQGL